MKKAQGHGGSAAGNGRRSHMKGHGADGDRRERVVEIVGVVTHM